MPTSDTVDLFQQGIELFNTKQFYDCHEVLEEVWTPTRQPDRWFLQSLIHFAVGFYHYEQGNRVGAIRQLHKGLHKIQDYLPEWDGVLTAEIECEVRRRLQCIETGQDMPAFPRISQTRQWPGLRSAVET